MKDDEIFVGHRLNGRREKGVITKLDNFMELRMKMVEKQLVSREIKNTTVLRAFAKVQRHLFVSENNIDDAYSDCALQIDSGQTISRPYVVALMTELLASKNTRKVLEIGTGSGYQTAILAEIFEEVYTIEVIEKLSKKSKKIFSKLNYDNIIQKIGDGYKGIEEEAPFDAIIVTCAPSHIPKPLERQLANKGQMVIPVGTQGKQELILLYKENNRIYEKEIVNVHFVPMCKTCGSKY